jgi:hypothetical protein
MSINFSILEDQGAVVISVSGHIEQSEVDSMRERTVAIYEETKISNFVMDISELMSIEKGSTFTVFELGTKFRATGFPLHSKTAVVMPTDAQAREQAELLHTVEINRGRGALKEVDSVESGLYWLRSGND